MDSAYTPSMQRMLKLFGLLILPTQGVSALAEYPPQVPLKPNAALSRVAVDSACGGQPLHFNFDSKAEAGMVRFHTVRRLRLEPGQPAF
jgi:hypothetical protein